MVFLAILVGNIHVNVQKYTTVERTDGYQLKSSMPSTKSALATSSIVDSLKIGDTQSQTDHNLAGVNMTSGTNSGRNWIESNNGWFSFNLASDSVVMQELKCTYWDSDAGIRGFDIYVNGVKVSFQKLNNNSPKSFFDFTYGCIKYRI